jgi:hypothetical protein
LFYSLIEKDTEYRGFYVDIGAFDPIVSSNTHLLHRRGWRGIDVDANPDALPRFAQHRPDDINLNAAVGDEGPPRPYFKFDDTLLNGFLAQEIVDRYGRLPASTSCSRSTSRKALASTSSTSTSSSWKRRCCGAGLSGGIARG